MKFKCDINTAKKTRIFLRKSTQERKEKKIYKIILSKSQMVNLMEKLEIALNIKSNFEIWFEFLKILDLSQYLVSILHETPCLQGQL